MAVSDGFVFANKVEWSARHFVLVAGLPKIANRTQYTSNNVSNDCGLGNEYCDIAEDRITGDIGANIICKRDRVALSFLVGELDIIEGNYMGIQPANDRELTSTNRCNFYSSTRRCFPILSPFAVSGAQS